MDGWWWPGFLIQFAIFMGILLLFIWWFLRWATKRIDKQLEELEKEERRLDQEGEP